MLVSFRWFYVTYFELFTICFSNWELHCSSFFSSPFIVNFPFGSLRQSRVLQATFSAHVKAVRFVRIVTSLNEIVCLTSSSSSPSSPTSYIDVTYYNSSAIISEMFWIRKKRFNADIFHFASQKRCHFSLYNTHIFRSIYQQPVITHHRNNNTVLSATDFRNSHQRKQSGHVTHVINKAPRNV